MKFGVCFIKPISFEGASVLTLTEKLVISLCKMEKNEAAAREGIQP
jgi:hypothetical protein